MNWPKCLYNNKPKNKIMKTFNEESTEYKIQEHGKSTLTDLELLQVLLSKSSNDATSKINAKILYDILDKDLRNLTKISASQLCKLKEIGIYKALQVVAIVELMNRFKFGEYRYTKKITTSADAYNILAPHLASLQHEEFHVLFLKQSNTVIKRSQIGKGGLTGTVSDPKIIFKLALECNACSIILAHNHPSGNLNHSISDMELTKKIKSAGKFLDIAILDHIIIAGDGYYSMADEGKF